ncbi:MAG TPA: biopolymer transporter ExbD [Steroidobacteraceae bacterium]|jgi:biopolymer transport protein ExbD|nr:biopolymer transporter ExbD [Steroidobacteraceae bacterium]
MAMSVGKDESDDASISDINTTPLVDVMLVLLIIFLITVPVIKNFAVTNIPKAVNIPTQTKPENIIIQVDKQGRIFWNTGVMPDRQVFFQRIVGEARKSPQPEFHIRADRETRWENIGRVIFNLQRGGIVKVGFITEPDRASIRVTR